MTRFLFLLLIVSVLADQVPFAVQSGFSLRHVFDHGTGIDYQIHRRLDVPRSMTANANKFTLKRDTHNTVRMADRSAMTVESYLEYARKKGAIAMELDWVKEQVEGPNVTDVETLTALAKMTADAYVNVPETGNWVDVGLPYNESSGFGWDRTGVRGHVFADDTNSTVIIAIKGTSAAMLDSDSETSGNDKVNDNLLFSCCCARISRLWSTVCDCYESGYKCSQSCIEDALYGEDKYYRALLDLYKNTTELYPDANIWATGHSLGGAMASLLGRTFGLPTVAFEAPAEKLAAKRLHLPFPPVADGESELIWHFGNTADPVFMGVCNGATSACWVGGYAMETTCHSGLECVYDTVGDYKWHVSISSHRIRAVIDMIMSYNTTANCTSRDDCVDCYDWTYD
ncbi:Alpha/Beta hydrolase protein [Lipomyces arxii]|uniref:Alpha/Beta hydrolase protein n=1 Tax=Lipomyces arxii TaxID=56418 RepID=UPI0034CE316E